MVINESEDKHGVNDSHIPVWTLWSSLAGRHVWRSGSTQGMSTTRSISCAGSCWAASNPPKSLEWESVGRHLLLGFTPLNFFPQVLSPPLSSTSATQCHIWLTQIEGQHAPQIVALRDVHMYIHALLWRKLKLMQDKVSPESFLGLCSKDTCVI